MERLERIMATKKDTPPVEISDELREHVEQIATEAKAKFTLKERLSGFKPRRQKVMLFLDLEAMDKVAGAKAMADSLFAQAERPGLEQKRRRDLLDQYSGVLDDKERLTQALGNTLGVAHIVTIHNVDMERAVRRARKGIAAKRTMMVTRSLDEALNEDSRLEAREWLEDEQDHFATEVNVQTLVFGMERLVFSDQTYEPLDAQEVRDLHETLPPNQWRMLTETFETLMFDEQIAREAVDEPGFSQGS